MEQGELTLGADCLITGNNGNGLFAVDSDLTMLGGSKIHDNTSHDNVSPTGTSSSGGIYLQSSRFTMEGGEISENRASVSGGGLYLTDHSSAVMKTAHPGPSTTPPRAASATPPQTGSSA
jgi:hypothetical protein